MKKTDVLAYFGSQTETAKALNISDSAVHYWGEIIPQKWCAHIQVVSKGKLVFNPKLYSNKTNDSRHREVA